MGLCIKVWICVVSVLGLAIVGDVAKAEDSVTYYLYGHNDARSEVGVENIVWNNTVAAFAQDYANQRTDCQLIHSGGGGMYGENIAMSTGEMSAAEAVKMWVDEKQYYDYDSNSCAAGQQCGHYTQVVWRKSVQLGCAKVRCNNGGTFITCNYSPPGNFLGERPY